MEFFYLLHAEILFIIGIFGSFSCFLYNLVLYNLKYCYSKYDIFPFFKISCFLLCLSFLYLKYSTIVELQSIFDGFFYSTSFMVFGQIVLGLFGLSFFFLFSILNRDFIYFFEIFFLSLNVLQLANILFIVNDFFVFFIIFEGISLSIYILATVNLSSLKTSEAGLKYFLYGVFVSIFLFISLLCFYSLYGTLNISKIILFQEQDFFNNFSFNLYINKYIYMLGIFLFISCLLFKLGVVPFHIQVIDVYSSVSLSMCFFFMIIIKFIFCFILFKSIFFQFKYVSFFYFYFFSFCSFFSIVISSIGALYEINLRRLLAQSSINHIGFLLFLCISINVINMIIFFVYLIVYLSLLVLFMYIYVKIYELNINFETLFDLMYLFKGSVFLGFSFSFIFLMIAGLPPFLGFQIKQLVFFSLSIQVNYLIFFKQFFLFFLLVINTINIYIYLRFVIYLFSEINFMFFFTSTFIGIFSIFIFINIFGFLFCIFLFDFLYNLIFNQLINSFYIL